MCTSHPDLVLCHPYIPLSNIHLLVPSYFILSNDSDIVMIGGILCCRFVCMCSIVHKRVPVND